MIYVIIADGEIDQIVEGKAIAQREKRDLQRMGCEVKLKAFEHWDAAHEFESRHRGW